MNVILANGDFPKHPRLLHFLRTAEQVIACDGAADKMMQAGLSAPAWIVGDLDSISKEVRLSHPERLVQIKEQETNDLTKAVCFCQSKNIIPAMILGASGGREDHLLGNLSRFALFTEIFPSIRLYTEQGYFCAVKSSGLVKMPLGTQFSIFSFDCRQKISLVGAKYPVKNLNLPFWHCATLNEAAAEEIEIISDSSVPVLIFVNWYE